MEKKPIYEKQFSDLKTEREGKDSYFLEVVLVIVILAIVCASLPYLAHAVKG